MWQMGGFGPMLGPGAPLPRREATRSDQRYGLERYSAETRRLYGVLDRRLAEGRIRRGRDIRWRISAILGWAWRHERHKVDLADFPNVRRWYGALMMRPGVTRGFAVALSR